MAKLVRKAAGAAGAGALGAALAYFLDPDRGRSRRARAKEEAERRARYTQGRVEGAKARSQGFGTPTPVDDVTLAQEVKAALSSLPFSTPDVTVEAVSGKITLRGQLTEQAEIDQATEAVAGVPGVTDVESHLHLPDAPAPNKADAEGAGAGPTASGDGAPVHHG
ncbi:MAG TPA: BON domain-containing protein [Acidimicrobiales bacterium]|nr:BON domain-containing protein [Acidimicrobiales bacterium]